MSSVFQNEKKDINKIVNIEGIEGAALPNALNIFYCRFEKHDFSTELSFLMDGMSQCKGPVEAGEYQKGTWSR